MKLFHNKKGQGVFEQLSGLGIGVAGLAIVLVVVFLILSQLASNSQVVADANASEAVADIQTAADTIPDFVSIVIIAVIGAVLIGLVSLFGLGGRR